MSCNLTTVNNPFNETCFSSRIIHRSFGLSVGLAVLFTILTVLTALGNVFVITAVVRIKKLQHPSNLLIVSLACSDLLVSIVVMPFGSYYEYNQVWDLGEVACDIFIVFDVLLCTASILNICAISIDRYLVITQPLAYDIKRTPKRMLIMIAIAWVSAALISIPPTFGFKDPFKHGVCAYSQNFFYQIYATFGAFYLPLIVMLTLYGRIVVLARNIVQSERNCRTSGSEKGQTTITPSTSESQARQGSVSCNCLKSSTNTAIQAVSSETVHRDSSPNSISVTQFDEAIVLRPAASTDRSSCETLPVDAAARENVPNTYLPLTKIATETSERPCVLTTAQKYQEHREKFHHYSRLPAPVQLLSRHSYGFDKAKPSERTDTFAPVAAISVVRTRQPTEYILSAPRRAKIPMPRQQFSLQATSPPNSVRHDSETCFTFNSKTIFLGLRGSRSRAHSVNLTNLCGPQRRRPPTSIRQRGSSAIYFQQQQQTKKAVRRRSSEKKAIITLGVLMGVFCFCWLPFFIVALGLPVYNYINKTHKDINPHLKSVLLWLGYVNSTINPMIYTIFNREFRQPFYEILHCRCRGINARMRIKQYELDYGPLNSYIFHSAFPKSLHPSLFTPPVFE
uniref:5-hydroxytryptamine receptor 1 n=1 Tax=Schistocephalus solidus TaxID=70667 RepID=A0A0X3NZE9_SCHSO